MIRIISVGEPKKQEIVSLLNFYMKQMKRARLETVKDQEHVCDRVKSEFVIACSEEGEKMSSPAFASLLQKNMDKHIAFVIGDAHGLDDSIKKKADIVLSLSQMTMPHEMALLFLVEQIYRGLSINAGKKYHK